MEYEYHCTTQQQARRAARDHLKSLQRKDFVPITERARQYVNRQNFLQIGPVYPTYVNRQIPLPKQAAAAGKEASESPLARAILKRRSVGWKPATVFRTVLLPYSVLTVSAL